MKKARSKSKSKNKLQLGTIQSDFINITSHQLRTPLSGMKWILELLEKGDTKNLTKKQKDFIEKIYYSNERMIALVDDLLEVSRIESGDLEMVIKPTDITSLIRVLIREKEAIVKKKGLQVMFTIEQEPFPQALTSPIKIRQALANIVNNAILYTPRRGKIEIDLKLRGGMILGTVADSGIGIPKDQQPRVFTKFFRGSNVLSVEAVGTGLGMFISKSFIEASGGQIWFRSKLGKGTTFFFTLPIVKKT